MRCGRDRRHRDISSVFPCFLYYYGILFGFLRVTLYDPLLRGGFRLDISTSMSPLILAVSVSFVPALSGICCCSLGQFDVRPRFRVRRINSVAVLFLAAGSAALLDLADQAGALPSMLALHACVPFYAGGHRTTRGFMLPL